MGRFVLKYKKAAYRRKKSISKGIVNEISVEDIIRSHCPPYMKPPYGARTRISTCISTGLVDPPIWLRIVGHFTTYLLTSQDSLLKKFKRKRQEYHSALSL